MGSAREFHMGTFGLSLDPGSMGASVTCPPSLGHSEGVGLQPLASGLTGSGP